MPTSNEMPGAGRVLLEQHRDRPRPGQRAVRRTGRPSSRRRGRAPPAARRAVRSSSRRKCRDSSAASRNVGNAARNSRGLGLGEHQRRGQPDPVGHGVVHEEPAGAGGRRHRGGRPACGSPMPISRPAPRTVRTSGWPSPSTPVAISLPTCVDVVEQAVLGDRAQHGERGGAAHRVAAERGAVLAGLQQVAPAAPSADARADRQAAAEALGERDDVGRDAAACWYANQEPVRPMPVCTSSSTSSAPRSAVISPGRLQVARRAG